MEPGQLNNQLIAFDRVSKSFKTKQKQHWKKAIDNISLTIGLHQSIGLIGESGSGKTTLARLILRLLLPDSGKIYINNKDLQDFTSEEMERFRCQFQIIFQNPFACLNPHRKIGKILLDPLEIHKLCPVSQFRERIEEMLEKVGLDTNCLEHFPWEFSGGERQRLYIARILTMEPKFLVADEPTSSLDIINNAEILKLIQQLKEKNGFSLLYISHDLRNAKQITERIDVMYQGRIIESAPTKEFFINPLHPYSASLLKNIIFKQDSFKAVPAEELRQQNEHSGCDFFAECEFKLLSCLKNKPELKTVTEERKVACFKY